MDIAALQPVLTIDIAESVPSWWEAMYSGDEGRLFVTDSSGMETGLVFCPCEHSLL